MLQTHFLCCLFLVMRLRCKQFSQAVTLFSQNTQNINSCKVWFMQSQILHFVRISLFSIFQPALFSRMLLRKITHHSSKSVYSQYSTMPKKNKTSKSNPKLPEKPSGPVTKSKDGGIAIAIHAKPGAKQNAITDVSKEGVGVAIAAPPTDGEANAELLRYLSKVLELKKSEISLDKGSKSREKIIKVTASVSQEDILEKLRREATG